MSNYAHMSNYAYLLLTKNGEQWVPEAIALEIDAILATFTDDADWSGNLRDGFVEYFNGQERNRIVRLPRLEVPL